MKEHGNIVGMFGGCHRAEGFVAGAIMVFTTWPWRWFKPKKVSGHSSVGFIYEDGYREIYEAREGKSWQGPIPVEKVRKWVARNPKKRRFTTYDIPSDLLSRIDMTQKKKFCERKLGVWDYSIMQLPRMGVRKYLPFLPMKPTVNNVVCSEAATLVLEIQVPILATIGKPIADRVTPFDYERALKQICEEKEGGRPDVSDAYKN